MTQQAVEKLLGRLITDEQFRRIAGDSLETACIWEGYNLSPEELQLLSGLDLNRFSELALMLDPGLLRVSGESIKDMNLWGDR